MGNHYPEERTDKEGKRRLTCVCGNELPCPQECPSCTEKDAHIKEIEGELTSAWMIGYHKRDDEVRELKARIATLKWIKEAAVKAVDDYDNGTISGCVDREGKGKL